LFWELAIGGQKGKRTVFELLTSIGAGSQPKKYRRSDAIDILSVRTRLYGLQTGSEEGKRKERIATYVRPSRLISKVDRSRREKSKTGEEPQRGGATTGGDDERCGLSNRHFVARWKRKT